MKQHYRVTISPIYKWVLRGITIEYLRYFKPGTEKSSFHGFSHLILTTPSWYWSCYYSYLTEEGTEKLHNFFRIAHLAGAEAGLISDLVEAQN